MPKFQQLIQIEGADNGSRPGKAKTEQGKRRVQKRPKVAPKGRGCEFCPLNKVPGVKKIFGRVRGKSIFVWGQSPGPVENKEGKELLGPAGKWWWNECRAAGILREHVDIQNVVRCFPADYDNREWPPLKMRTPVKAEIKCCSIYNDKALQKSQAKVHLILGQIAAKSLLGQEYRKDKRVFWSKRLKARVVCLDHPAFFVRRGGPSVQPTDAKLLQFRRDLRYAASIAKVGGGKYGYIKSQNYRGVCTIKAARLAYRQLVRYSKLGYRLSADLEEGRIDDKGRPARDFVGIRVPLVYGFCGKPGESFVFALDHPDSPATPKARRYNRKIVRRLLTDPDIRFIFQHGSYDVTATRELFGYAVANYDYDTNYAEYFAYPDRYAYGLGAIADARFPQFSEYKSICAPECFTDKFRKFLKDTKKKRLSLTQKYELARKYPGGTNLAQMPWAKMVIYNGADNDIQKRIEVTTKKKVSLPLLHIYQDAQFVLNLMQKNPPRFDYRHFDKISELYPVQERLLYKQLVQMSGKKDFNPNSPPQVSHVIYKKLKLPALDETPNTRKETMAALAQYHPFPAILVQYRRVAKICSTYLAGFKRSADMNDGHVKTIWWLTGTRTGRMSSGGGDSGDDGVVNLQNIHGDPLLQCLLISDVRWRNVYRYWRAHGPFTAETWKQFRHVHVFLGFDHSQMELRVVAQKSGDPELIKIFRSGKDLHAEVGHSLTGWSIKELTENEEKRRIVKNMQFGLVYGLNEQNLPNYMRAKGVKNVKDRDVVKYVRRYFERFARVKDMIDNDREFVAAEGFAGTLFGFRRYLNTHDQSKGGAYWGNQAINTPIQGTAHQLMLMGLVPIHRKPKTYTLLQAPQLEIHDAVYFDVVLEDMFEAAALGKEMLEREALRIVKRDFRIDWKVPLKAEPKAALRFGVQVKNIGGENGPKTPWEFLNKWCEYNQKLQKSFSKQMMEVGEMQLKVAA